MWSVLAVIPMVVALTGCGIQATDPLPFGEPAGGVEIGTQLYFVLDGKIFPTLRRVDGGEPVDTLNLLAAGPTPEEQAAGLTTEVPAGIRLLEGSAPAAVKERASPTPDQPLMLYVFGTGTGPTELSALAVTQLACTAVAAYRRGGFQVQEIVLTERGGRTRPAAGCPASAGPGAQ
jgi:hypothetical protein